MLPKEKKCCCSPTAVSAEITRLLLQHDAAAVDAATALSFHAVLRSAIGNGKGPKLPKLRASFAALFDAALVQLDERFPPTLAADLSLWAMAAATHPRLTKPEHALNASSFEPPAAQLCDALRRLVDEREKRKLGGLQAAAGGGGQAGGGLAGGGQSGGSQVGGNQPSEGLAGGSLREPCLRLAFELLEAVNGLAKQPWARERSLQALALAKELGTHCWLTRERLAIDKMLSTARARFS